MHSRRIQRYPDNVNVSEHRHVEGAVQQVNSDLFDVLAFVAYAQIPVNREQRAGQAKVEIGHRFNYEQQAFLDFVLSQYVQVGVEELDQTKLTPLIRLKYQNSIADAVADLGKPDEIGKVFSGFQNTCITSSKPYRNSHRFHTDIISLIPLRQDYPPFSSEIRRLSVLAS
ncbi:type I restriction-modification enzyme R subunit C-terminal domain-containing protein [Methylomonas koyamae]|uniref:type I restriction-modification enzyme R subunit C-terminal domain-containing protein n=1 Tax=Methylomonas koyamae TaxID=702114 RepID=UPI000BC35D9B|nr:type I restriction-modification enzyme R subunit C-terminal domain-containing protein [Methylomonas koyamae]ATG91407.1 hypothetical protein MKLM6_3212 [Methylomonas koyamae]